MDVSGLEEVESTVERSCSASLGVVELDVRDVVPDDQSRAVPALVTYESLPLIQRKEHPCSIQFVPTDSTAGLLDCSGFIQHVRFALLLQLLGAEGHVGCF